MPDRTPANITVVFDDGQTLFIHGEQMSAFTLKTIGVALPDEIVNPLPEDAVGYFFQLTVGFLLGASAVNTEADNINKAIEPYLVNFKKLPPLSPDIQVPDEGEWVNFPGGVI